jgi:thiol-disulfide isomerase/thioredoxin
MHPGRRALLGRSLGLWAGSVLAGGLCAACYGVPVAAPFASAPSDWNSGEIAWAEYRSGLVTARAEGKPIVLIFYTDWCPHCHNYSRLFHDPDLVRLSRQFVMIRVERDGNRDISAVYDIDGEYIPRTFFLAPTGAVLTDLDSGDEDFRYFLDEHDPAQLSALMLRALERVGAGPF